MLYWVFFIVCVDCFVTIGIKYKLPYSNLSESHFSSYRLAASARSIANRHRKDLQLIKLVKKRRQATTERYEELARINIRNDKCNIQLSRLPVSPITNLNHIVPFKTIRNFSSYKPLNHRTILRTIGYQFKDIPDPTLTSERARAVVEAGLPLAERFERVYHYDKRMRVEDARGVGVHSRRPTKFPMTGESDKMPTPMDSVKSHKEWQERMLNPKYRPLPIKNYNPLYEDTKINIGTFYETRQRLIDFVNQITKIAPSVLQRSDVKKIVDTPADVKWSRTLDSAVDEGDIFLNPKYLGEEDYFQNPFYGNPALPSEIKSHLEEYNANNPDSKITYDMLACDLIYCHSDGTIMKLIESSPPYGGEAEDFPHKDPWEPRYIIQAVPGFIKNHNLKVGDPLQCIDKESRFTFYDNYYALPKSVRIPLRLPLGRMIN